MDKTTLEDVDQRLKALEAVMAKFPSADVLEKFGEDVIRFHNLARLGKNTGKAVFWAATLLSLWYSTKQALVAVCPFLPVAFPFLFAAHNHKGPG